LEKKKPPPSAKAEYSSLSERKKLTRRRNFVLELFLEFKIKFGARKFPSFQEGYPTLVGGVVDCFF
jgi:hypothetical protein